MGDEVIGHQRSRALIRQETHHRITYHPSLITLAVYGYLRVTRGPPTLPPATPMSQDF
jgi:hypothetical protein